MQSPLHVIAPRLDSLKPSHGACLGFCTGAGQFGPSFFDSGIGVKDALQILLGPEDLMQLVVPLLTVPKPFRPGPVQPRGCKIGSHSRNLDGNEFALPFLPCAAGANSKCKVGI